MLGVSVPKLYYGLPIHYYVMAFIIQQKLQNMGLKLSKVM